MLTSTGVWHSELGEMKDPDLVFVWHENQMLEGALCTEWFHTGIDVHADMWDMNEVIDGLLQTNDNLPSVCTEAAQELTEVYTPSERELYHA